MPGDRVYAPFEGLLSERVRSGIYKSKEFHGRGAKIVSMGELFAHPRLRPVAMKRVELTPAEQGRFALNAGDLLFARRSLDAEGAGKCSIVLDVDTPTVFESSIIRKHGYMARPVMMRTVPAMSRRALRARRSSSPSTSGRARPRRPR